MYMIGFCRESLEVLSRAFATLPAPNVKGPFVRGGERSGLVRSQYELNSVFNVVQIFT